MPDQVVTLQIGQCGNQVGTQMFGMLAREASRSTDPAFSRHVLDRYFRPGSGGGKGGKPVATNSILGGHDYGETSTSTWSAADSSACAPVARAVLVDMEPKVIASSIATARASGGGNGGNTSGGRWRYSPRRAHSQQSGSGNNWAFGYNVHGPRNHDAIMELVRKEAEASDCLSTFLLLQSLAGGTGSGLGSFVTEALRDAYGARCSVVNQVVFPYAVGEVSKFVRRIALYINVWCIRANANSHVRCATAK
jgi:tubulin delta